MHGSTGCALPILLNKSFLLLFFKKDASFLTFSLLISLVLISSKYEKKMDCRARVRDDEEKRLRKREGGWRKGLPTLRTDVETIV